MVNNMKMLHFISFTVALWMFIQTSTAIKCHICNSHAYYEGEECLKARENNKFLFDCDEYALTNNWTHGYHATLCRKIYQVVEGESRVVRSCALEGHTDTCVKRIGTKDVTVVYCQCEGDGCNTAAVISAPILTAIVMIIITGVLMFQRYSFNFNIRRACF